MTNYERYKNDIIRLIAPSMIGVSNGKPVACHTVDCKDCEFSGSDFDECLRGVNKWLDEEYIERI